MKYPIIYSQNGGTLNQITFVTFNVYGGGKLFEQRKDSITQTILSNNTPDIIDRNILKGDIFIQPARAAEFIVIDFNIMPTGATFSD